MQNKNKLTMHTSIRPDENPLSESHPAVKEESVHKIKTAVNGTREKRGRQRLSVSERLFRNTAVACALLLCVMALKNIDTPVTNKITGAVKSVVSMDMELPSSVGNLSFVQKLMPESALVFLNMTPASAPVMPVDGEIIHSYSDLQPWIEIKAADNAPVFSIMDGDVEACVQTDFGDYTVLIRNSDQTEYLYAFLESVSVQSGDSVSAGARIGSVGKNENARLYVELRLNGTPSEPEWAKGE